jgi:hypothetical protein
VNCDLRSTSSSSPGDFKPYVGLAVLVALRHLLKQLIRRPDALRPLALDASHVCWTLIPFCYPRKALGKQNPLLERPTKVLCPATDVPWMRLRDLVEVTVWRRMTRASEDVRAVRARFANRTPSLECQGRSWGVARPCNARWRRRRHVLGLVKCQHHPKHTQGLATRWL